MFKSASDIIFAHGIESWKLKVNDYLKMYWSELDLSWVQVAVWNNIERRKQYFLKLYALLNYTFQVNLWPKTYVGYLYL